MNRFTSIAELPVKISNEQIEAEIESLTADANRMLASAKETFAELAKIRLQVGLLKKLRDLRVESDRHSAQVSFVLLGFVTRDEGDPSPFCALTWAGELLSPNDVRLLLKADWESIMPADIAVYFAALLEDWKALLRTTPEMLLIFASELSVGPIRTMETAKVDQERASTIIRQKLGTILQFPPEVTPIS